MRNVLIINGHPNPQQSTANQAILDNLQCLLPTAQIRTLGDLYADNAAINVVAEQAALVEADIIVWQFPLHWYHLPALMKKWLDEVHVYGFAHGSTGTALQGKKLILSFTTGAAEEQYQYGAAMNYPITDFLPSLRQTASLCGMVWQEPVYSMGMMYMPGVSSEADLSVLKQKAQVHAERLAKLIQNLSA